jgi:peptide/nickel transport system substrate-binding protein
MAEKIKAGSYDMAVTGFRVKTYPDMTMMYSKSYYDSDLDANIAGYQNEEADRLAMELYTTHDAAGRQNIFTQLASIIKDDMPYVGLYFHVSTTFFRNDIKGFEKPTVWNPFGSIRRWYKADYS